MIFSTRRSFFGTKKWSLYVIVTVTGVTVTEVLCPVNFAKSREHLCQCCHYIRTAATQVLWSSVG